MQRILYQLFLFVAILMGLAYAQKPVAKPNIILFLVDDMGWMDTSVPFGDSAMPLNHVYHTPNMERLAREGMKFTSAYAAPVCTPSRTSLMSGMNAAHHGITNWTSPVKDRNTDEKDEQFDAADWKINGLSPVPGIDKTTYATMLPQLLEDAGYYTIFTGKAHWASAGTPGANPLNMGFMVNIAGHSAGHPRSYLGKDNYGNIPGKPYIIQSVPDLEEFYGTDTFLTEALTLKAEQSLEVPVKRKQPFFLYLAHYAVHAPIMADQRFVQRYYDAGMDSTEAKYASLIEGMDKSLGDIMEWLQKKGCADNTIILFMSDNGGLALSPPRGGHSFTQNLPLRSGKGSVCEGGIREPMIVKWHGVVKPGSRTDRNVIIEDFFPTILDMAGVRQYHTVQTIDGKSFLPLLQGKAAGNDQRVLIWHFPNKWLNGEAPGHNYYSAIRQGDWKLLYNMRNGKTDLYNIRKDIREDHDLSAQYPDKTKSLLHLLATQLSAWQSPMPFDKTTGKEIRVNEK